MKPAVLVSLTLAILTSLWTWWPSHSAAVNEQAETRQGKLLTVSGEKVAPEKVGYLRVANWDKELKAAKLFEVANKEGKWVIPTYFDYPADGGTRVGTTAGSVLNVPCGPLVTHDASRHAELGVLDPEKEGLADAEARGKRITLKEAGGAPLVDLIVGKKEEKANVYFVRQANEDSVYTASVNVDISTGFKDWVETDLLKIERADIRSIEVHDYSVDLKAERFEDFIKERSAVTLSKPKDAADWGSAQTPPDKKVNEDTTGRMLDELTGLRLVGIRPMIPIQQVMEQKGFYILLDKRLVQREDLFKIPTNQGPAVILPYEGSVVVVTKDGLRYDLLFGGVNLGDEREPEADAEKDKKEKGKDKEKGETKIHNRNLVVFAQYDPKLDESKTAKPADPKDQKEPAGVSVGQKKAEKAKRRFEKFFYVVSDPSFKRLRPAAGELFRLQDVAKDKLPGEKPAKEKDIVKALSGLQYLDVNDGDGSMPEDGDTVEVHYTGWLEKEGTQFDSSRGLNVPFKFELGKGQVIKGWDEGVKGMKLGGKRKLIVPPELGYGAPGSPPKIPAEARLIFDVELLKIVRKSGEILLPKEAPKTPEKNGAPKTPEKSEAPKAPGGGIHLQGEKGPIVPKPPEPAANPPAVLEPKKTAEPVKTPEAQKTEAPKKTE